MTHQLGLPIIVTLILASVGCGDGSGNPDACPVGPTAPLGDTCSDDGLTCAYGYAPAECGGRTVICRSSVFEELEHTDPQPSCFADSGVADALADGDAARDGAVEDATVEDTGTPDPVSCGSMTCGVDEYCFVECLCCGFDAGVPSESRATCVPIPAECSADDICSCDSIRSDGCDGMNRRIDSLCA